jgi:hypothetical protein
LGRPEVALDNNTAERTLRNPVVGRKNYYHIPPDLVVDQWTSDAESSSPPDFLLRYDLGTTFRRLMMSQITSTISTV